MSAAVVLVSNRRATVVFPSVLTLCFLTVDPVPGVPIGPGVAVYVGGACYLVKYILQYCYHSICSGTKMSNILVSKNVIRVIDFPGLTY